MIDWFWSENTQDGILPCSSVTFAKSVELISSDIEAFSKALFLLTSSFPLVILGSLVKMLSEKGPS